MPFDDLYFAEFRWRSARQAEVRWYGGEPEMATLTIELGTDALAVLTRAASSEGTRLEDYIATAAELFALEQEGVASPPPTAEEAASMRRALVDVAAGRLTDHNLVFKKLDAKHGWG